MLSAQFNWLTASVYVGLYGVDTVFNAAHTDIGDLAGAQIAVVEGLTAKNTANGYATSSPAVFNQVPAPTVVAVVILYESSGDLIAFIDDASGVPFTPTDVGLQLIPIGAGGAWFRL
jgi:hypothetical protein